MMVEAASSLAPPSPAPSPLLRPRLYQVTDKVFEVGEPGVSEIVSLHVNPVDGSLPYFEPAQVGMVGAFGVGEAAISISSATDNTDYHAYTIRRAGPISGALVDTPVGGTITIRAPFGRPWPIDEVDTGHLVIVGGGLGIAPLRAAIERAVAQQDRFETLTVFYGAKEPDLLVYRRDLARWQEAGARVVLTVDDARGPWAGPVGVVPDLLVTDAGRDLGWSDTTAFICGPDIMMHFAAANLQSLGVPDSRIWLTLERNMQCGNALCGHCQLGPFIVCRDGPVASYADIGRFHRIKDL